LYSKETASNTSRREKSEDLEDSAGDDFRDAEGMSLYDDIISGLFLLFIVCM
jgi:hypothetical protein